MSVAPRLHQRPASRHRLAGLLWRVGAARRRAAAAPLGWLGGRLPRARSSSCFIASFWTLNEFSGLIVKGFSLDNFRTIIEEPVYRKIVLRTVSIAALVTITDIVLAFPIAFYMARVATPRRRAALAVAVLMPLWASYLVKVYSWRTMFANDGILNWAARPDRAAACRSRATCASGSCMAYLWLPYMILPLYAGLERIPDSLLDASGDLGARPWRTFRSVVRAAGDAGDRGRARSSRSR